MESKRYCWFDKLFGDAMAQQFCQGCGASLMPTLRMCPTCGSKNLDANPPQAASQVTPTYNQSTNKSSATTPSVSELKGLSGWLILIGIGLIIGAIRVLANLISIYKPFMNTDLLDKVTDINSSSYIPNFALLFYAELIVNSFMVLLCIYLIYLFFRKNRKFPKYYIFITLFVILTIPVDAYLTSIVLPDEKMLDKDTIKSFFQSLFAGAIWIPYMLKSVRVRNTFIED